MVTDTELVRKCKEGNQKYQEMLYNRFAPKLMAIALRYARNQADAEDILHDSFVKVLTNLDNYNEDGSLDGWVKRITVNTAINAYYKKKKMEDSIEVEDVREMTTAVNINYNDFLSEKILLQLINELPDGYRTVFNMFEIDGYSHKEISEMTGSSYSTVRSQLFKAKRALKKRLEEFLGEEYHDKLAE